MSKANTAKPKDNYFKITFLLPVVYSFLTAILMIVAVLISRATRMPEDKIETALTIVRLATYSLALSPSALMIAVYFSRRHIMKNPDGSSFYKMRPMVFSLTVMGLQVLYMLSLAL